MSIFVNPNETFEVSFVTGSSKDGKSVYCDVDLAKLKEVNDDLDEATVETHSCTFRRPTFEDNMYISDGSVDVINGEMRVNPSRADFRRVVRLLRGWSFKENGSPVPVTERAVASLNPEVANVIGYLLNNRL